jgi:hypothetical protein
VDIVGVRIRLRVVEELDQTAAEDVQADHEEVANEVPATRGAMERDRRSGGGADTVIRIQDMAGQFFELLIGNRRVQLPTPFVDL